MAIAVRGTPSGSYAHWATATAAWPVGSAVGDLAVVYLSENKSGNPSSKLGVSGWKLVASGYAETVWQKVLTASDIAAGLPIIGYLYELCVFSGASKVGRVASSSGVSCVAGGAALFFGWENNERVGQMTPLTEKLFASDIINDSYNYRPNNAWFRVSPTAGYVSWVSSADHEITVELLPLAAPPAPVLVSPTTGTQVNPGVVNTFTWTNQSTRAQAEYRFRLREVGTTPWYWVTAAGELTLTDTGVASQSPSASLAAGALTTAKTYEWQVATSDGGLPGPYSASWQVPAVAPPVVTGITVTSPAGDLTPTVAHTATFGVGAQQAYHLRLSTSATDSAVGVTYDSGVVSSASASNEVPVQDWVNGQAQYAWLRVQQGGGMWSAWTRDDVTHTVSWTPPSVPTLALSGGTPGVPVIVTVSGLASGNNVQLQAAVGGVWRDVATVPVTDTSRDLQDPLAAYNVVTEYRARRQALVSTTMMWSAWSASSNHTNIDTAAYLVGDDGTWLAVRVREDDERYVEQGVSVWYPMGAKKPSIDMSERQGESGSLVFNVPTQADRAALLAWLDLRTVWTLRWNPEHNDSWVFVDVPATRMGPASGISYSRFEQTPYQRRELKIDWVEQ